MQNVDKEEVLNVVVDFETLGLPRDRGVALDLSATYFTDTELLDGSDKPVLSFKDLIERSLTVKFDVADQIDTYGRTTDQGVIDWWKKQSEDARSLVAKSERDVSLSTGINTFFDWLDHPAKKTRLWARGMVFDLCLLEDLMKDVEYNRFMAFWNYRDTRTWFAGCMLDPNYDRVPVSKDELDGFVAHNSSHDVAKDALMCMYAPLYASGATGLPTDPDPSTVVGGK